MRQGKVHIALDAIRALGQPNYIRFMLNQNGTSMVMEPYHKLELQSIRVPKDIDQNLRKCRFGCIRLCRLLAYALGWDDKTTYRIPGKIIPAQKIVIFDMTKATNIHDSDSLN